MFGAGAVMQGLPGEDFKVAPDVLAEALESTGWGDPHHSQPSVLSLTIPTDFGTVYAPDEVAALADTANPYGMRVHVDGARVANAIEKLGVSPADLTWRAGVDVLSLGATKNGVMSTDAIVCFDPAISEQLVYRTKRAGHVPSKLRFQSAQLGAYLSGGLWLELAGNANRAMARLSQGLAELGVEFVNRPDVNILYVRMDEQVIDRMEEAGLLFYRIGPGLIRLVTSFETTPEDADEAVGRVAVAIG
jgi:threonine aldolase